MLDAEALLLVDDDEAEILEPDAVAEQAVRADHDVDRALGEAVDRVLRLLVGLEAAEGAQVHRESGEPLGERLHVLPHEQRRRHQHRDLLAVLHRLERGAHGDLGLAVADVARDEPVHRDRPLHVGLHLVDGLQLVGRLGERERLLQLALPRGVGAERVAGARHPGAVELDQLDGDVAHRLARLALGGRPVGSAHLAERGALAADVAGEQVELVGRHVELVARVSALARRVLEHEVLAHDLRLGHRGAERAARRALTRGDLALHELEEAADAVGLVHDVVAGLAAAADRRRSCGGSRAS